MIVNCLIILLVFFIVAALAILYRIAGSDKGVIKSELIKKYYWYFIIVMATALVIVSDNFLLKGIFLSIILVFGFIELKNLRLNSKKWLVLIIYLLIGFMALFAFIWFDAYILLPLYVFVAVFDGMSQIGGQLLGRHKMAVNISPAKTWEGLVIGSLSAFLSIWFILNYQLQEFFSYWHFIGCAIFAVTGDLLTSKLKRMGHVKDFSTLIPGHGGVLDRFDSFLGVLFYLYLILIVFKVI